MHTRDSTKRGITDENSIKYTTLYLYEGRARSTLAMCETPGIKPPLGNQNIVLRTYSSEIWISS